LKKGDIVLTGTPGGVILNVPRWKMRLSKMLNISRFQKLKSLTSPSNSAKFLAPGDKVSVEGCGLGKVEIVIAKSSDPE